MKVEDNKLIIGSKLIQSVLPAPDPPSHLQIAQTGQRSVRVSWIPSPGSSVNVTGYIIYLTPQQGEEMVSNVEGSETSTEITDLTEAMTYSVTIVANSNTLSSNVNGPENITLGIYSYIKPIV